MSRKGAETPDAAGEALIEALTKALAALENGDPDGAAAAMAVVAGVCDDARPGTDVVLSPERLALARTLHARCEERAARAQQGIVAELLQTASHRKANNAYGSGR